MRFLMNQEIEQEKDNFWLYIGLLVAVLITVILLVKKNETEKFAPIKQLLNEEKSSMQIRILKDY